MALPMVLFSSVAQIATIELAALLGVSILFFQWKKATVQAVWITFQSYNFSAVAVFAVISSKTAANGHLSLLKSYPNWP